MIPAEALAAYLVSQGIGSEVGSGQPWPIYVGHMPDTPDEALCVYDTVGIQHGRIQETGETQEHHGVQIRVRAMSYPVGRNKAVGIAQTLDAILRNTVVVGSDTYFIQSATRTGGIPYLGLEKDGVRRLFTVNALLSLRIL